MPDYTSKTFSENLTKEFAQLTAQIPAVRVVYLYEVNFKRMDGFSRAFYKRNPDPSTAAYGDLEDCLGAMSHTCIDGMSSAAARLALGEWDYFVIAGPEGRALYMALTESKEQFLILIIEPDTPLSALVAAVKAHWEPLRKRIRD